MLNAVCDAHSNREVWFFYGVTNKDEHIMSEHLKEIAKAHHNINVRICYSDPRDNVDQPDVDFDFAERVSVDLFKRCLPSNNYDFYICGPPPMMTSLVDGLTAWQVPTDRIHFRGIWSSQCQAVFQNG